MHFDLQADDMRRFMFIIRKEFLLWDIWDCVPLVRLMGWSLCPLRDYSEQIKPMSLKRRTEGRIVLDTKINALWHFSSTVHRHCNFYPFIQPYNSTSQLSLYSPFKLADNCLYCRRICVSLTVYSVFFISPLCIFYLIPRYTLLQVSNDFPHNLHLLPKFAFLCFQCLSSHPVFPLCGS